MLQRSKRIVATCSTALVLPWIAWTAGADVVVHTLTTTADIQLSLPAPEQLHKALYRDAAGNWVPLAYERDGELLRLQVEVGSIRNGRTTIVLNAPDDVDLDDTEPPRVIRFEIDGQDHGSVTEVALGGIEQAPQRILLEVEDERNRLRPESLAVIVNGTSYDQSDNAVGLTLHGPRKATVQITLADLLTEPREANSVTVSIADGAFDSGMLRCSLSFRQAPSKRVDDGRTLSVDTVTPRPDWSDWWVVCNGEKMDSSFTTTRGHTWLSEANTQPHWLRMDFPEPRTVNGVAVWWAYWQCFRTSRAYEIQTWNGQKWVTQGTYTHDRDEQCSRHEFAPVTTSRVRFWQPANSGHPQGTGEVWLSEFEVF